ncbi:16S rRNA (guanine(966)-N(2))-methyltransferase RsmD [Desulfogranum mediterraneum]|uniref:16S rRNA (guanine(966)-N(2))-methyltransferase RsmD n=1 Tax=Desulfogranum mediterraneum TaxID=160661 RepID=UPI00040ADDF9|nr:16S rRNA (guanine(966)-N(2))-methyltransferase RsmD [Desulfogranum mediterraneum]
MRITGGSARGRRLVAPKDASQTRPTSDRVREAIFNILAPQLAAARVLDLFAGTGALGIEALSRGADLAVFIDQSREASQLISTNLQHCFNKPRAFVLQQRLQGSHALERALSRLPAPLQFELILLDPPYGKGLVEPTLEMISSGKLLAPGGLIVVEEHRRSQLAETIINLECIDRRHYGETGIWIYSLSPAASNNPS